MTKKKKNEPQHTTQCKPVTIAGVVNWRCSPECPVFDAIWKGMASPAPQKAGQP